MSEEDKLSSAETAEETSGGLTRRSFLKSSAAVAAGAAILTGLSTGKGEAAPLEDVPEWDLETDVLVVGTGGAGLSAAVEAAESGSDVLVLEKADWVGGTTSMSGGLVTIPREGRVSDAVDYYLECGKGRVSREMAETWAEEAVKLKDWLSRFGSFGAREVSGYHPFMEGSDSLRQVSPEEGAGAGLSEALQRAAEDNGVRVRTNTKAVDAVADPSTKEVMGLRAESKGSDLYVKANKGVVLAAGGFGYNEEMKEENFRAWPKYDVGSPECKGEGILIGQALGGALWKMSETVGNLCHKVPEHEVAFPSMLQLGSQGIIVNKYGERFANEDRSYDAFHKAMDTYDYTEDDFVNIPCYGIFDEDIRSLIPVAYTTPKHEELGLKWSSDNSREIEKGWILKADDIRELAEKAELPPDRLERTLESWNETVEEGEDEQFGRTSGLQALDTPPFYAVEAYPGLWDTLGGLKTNTDSQVIDTKGEPIPRLYAAGNNGIGALCFHYPQGGSSIANGVAFGRIAGRNLADQEDWES